MIGLRTESFSSLGHVISLGDAGERHNLAGKKVGGASACRIGVLDHHSARRGACHFFPPILGCHSNGWGESPTRPARVGLKVQTISDTIPQRGISYVETWKRRVI